MSRVISAKPLKDDNGRHPLRNSKTTNKPPNFLVLHVAPTRGATLCLWNYRASKRGANAKTSRLVAPGPEIYTGWTMGGEASAYIPWQSSNTSERSRGQDKHEKLNPNTYSTSLTASCSNSSTPITNKARPSMSRSRPVGVPTSYSPPQQAGRDPTSSASTARTTSEPSAKSPCDQSMP